MVLAIVGVMAGVGILGLGAADRGARAEAEAQRLADRLQLAADEVLVTGAPHALVWDAEGYRFLAWDRAGAGWIGRAATPARTRARPRRIARDRARRLRRRWHADDHERDGAGAGGAPNRRWLHAVAGAIRRLRGRDRAGGAVAWTRGARLGARRASR